MSAIEGWMAANLRTQGYRFEPGEAERLRVGLRFSTGLCLPLVAAGLALESAPLILGASAIGLVAGFTPRHPFDELWNRAVRDLLRAPALPPNPRRRRHAFKLGAVWLMAIGALLLAGRPTAALALGIPLLGACLLVTATSFCVPSTALALVERRRAAH